MTLAPENVILPRNEEDITDIAGMENISNRFKTVNIYPKVNISDIGSVASRQSKKKGGKSPLSHRPKFSQTDASSTSSKTTETALEDNPTVKSEIKNQLRDAINYFKKSPIETTSFIAASNPKKY